MIKVEENDKEMIHASIKVFNFYTKKWENLNLEIIEHQKIIFNCVREEAVNSRELKYLVHTQKNFFNHGFCKMNYKYINYYWKDKKLV